MEEWNLTVSEEGQSRPLLTLRFSNRLSNLQESHKRRFNQNMIGPVVQSQSWRTVLRTIRKFGTRIILILWVVAKYHRDRELLGIDLQAQAQGAKLWEQLLHQVLIKMLREANWEWDQLVQANNSSNSHLELIYLRTSTISQALILILTVTWESATLSTRN